MGFLRVCSPVWTIPNGFVERMCSGVLCLFLLTALSVGGCSHESDLLLGEGQVIARARDTEITASVLFKIVSSGADDYEREKAAEHLAELGQEARIAVSTLVVALRDNNPRVRYWVARALGNIGPSARTETTKAALEATLRDNNLYVRSAAADAIERIGYLSEAEKLQR